MATVVPATRPRPGEVRGTGAASPPTRPRLRGRARRLVRAGHVAASGIWTGLVVTMLVLGVAGATGAGPVGTAAHAVMERIGTAVIPPFAVASLLSGALLSVMTPWGLVRHWWVVVKMVLGVAVVVTSVTVTDAQLAVAQQAGPAATVASRMLLGGSSAHLTALVVATVLSVDKPWGRTPRGRRLAGRAS